MAKNRLKLPNNRGLTLIEIMVVMTITIVVSAAFFWNWTQRDRQMALSSAQILASVLREARDKSTYYGVPAFFNIDKKSCTFTVETNPPIVVTKDFPLVVNKVTRGGNDINIPLENKGIKIPPFGNVDESYEFFFVKGNYEVSVRLNKYAALVQIIKPQ